MTVAPGRKRHNDTKSLILDEAEKLIGRIGYDELKLIDVATPLGIRVPSIYSHFEGREAVLAAVAERYIARLVTELFPYEDGTSPTEAVLSGARGLVRFHAKNPAYTRLKLRDLETPGGMALVNFAAKGTPEQNLKQGPVVPLYSRVAKILSDGFKTDGFRKIDFIPFWRTIEGTTLFSLTWPDQTILSVRRGRAKIELIADDVEALTKLLLGIEA